MATIEVLTQRELESRVLQVPGRWHSTSIRRAAPRAGCWSPDCNGWSGLRESYSPPFACSHQDLSPGPVQR